MTKLEREQATALQPGALEAGGGSRDRAVGLLVAAARDLLEEVSAHRYFPDPAPASLNQALACLRSAEHWLERYAVERENER